MADCAQALEKAQKALEKDEAVIQEMETLLQRLTAPPQKLAMVLKVVPEGVLVTSEGNQLLLLDVPELKIAKGDTVTMSPMTGQIIRKLARVESGEAGEVRQVHLDGMLAEVDVNGQLHMISTGAYAKKIKKGDKITVDSSKSLITEVIPSEESPYHLTDTVKVDWSEVGGLEDAKQFLREAIEYPMTYEKVFKFYNKDATKGILLYGPPGCGKTLLAKALATSLAKLQGKDVPGYIYVKGPEILDKYVGESERVIRHIFKAAREFGEAKQVRAVIFLDEADALLRRRGTGKSSDVESTIVPAFLAEMDGMVTTPHDPLVLLATNRPDTLDPAVIRDGRVDRKIKVTRPEKEIVRDIFKIHLKGKPLSESQKTIVHGVMEALYQQRPMYQLQWKEQREPVIFHFHNMLSGAMIEGIVNRAVSSAFRRDTGAKEPRGLFTEDLIKGVEESYREARDLDHADDINEFSEGHSLTNAYKLR